MRQQRLGAGRGAPSKAASASASSSWTETWKSGTLQKFPLQKGLKEALANISEISNAALCCNSAL